MTGLRTKMAALLTPEELIFPDSAQYTIESMTWAAQKDLKPHVVARPANIVSLQKLMAYLNTSDLETAVRSGGCGSSSARDLLISMQAFNDFTFDPKTETCVVGTGQSWSEVDRKLEESAPGYAVLSARSGFLGVGGSLTHGGLSWLSSEYGLACDPQNLLDAQVVLPGGQALWASAEPDLLWALRGGGGSFAAVTHVELKARKYTSSIFTGRVIYPRDALGVVAKAVADYAERNTDPKMAMHLYCMSLETYINSGENDKSAGTSVALLMYDAHGEAHGRSADGFEWALEIPGAIEMTQVVNYPQMNLMADEMQGFMGKANQHFSAITIPTVDEGLILRAWKWMEDLLERDPRLVSIPMGTFVLIEVMQRAAFSSVRPSDCAWPHTTNQHTLQLGVAAPPDSPESERMVFQALADAPSKICTNHRPCDFQPNFLNSFNDPKEIYGPNYDRLVALKKKYDPNGKLNGPFMPPLEELVGV